MEKLDWWITRVILGCSTERQYSKSSTGCPGFRGAGYQCCTMADYCQLCRELDQFVQPGRLNEANLSLAQELYNQLCAL